MDQPELDSGQLELLETVKERATDRLLNEHETRRELFVLLRELSETVPEIMTAEASMYAKTKATIDDLHHVPANQKAEIINGEVVLMSPTGAAPNFAGGEIFASLREFSRRTKWGRAVTDNAGFKVDLPHRGSFSPDAAFYVGETAGMKFFEGAPVFAAKVRSENDYGPRAEQDIARKVADYFAAGTEVVWDVDLLAENTITVHRAADRNTLIVYRRGEIAEAEPAVPGWTMPVDDLFD